MEKIVEVYNQYYLAARNILRKRGCNSYAFDDIFHDALIQLFNRKKSAKAEIKNPRAYIIQLCINLWKKECARQKVLKTIEESCGELAGEEEGVKDERGFYIKKHLKDLSPDGRKILILHSQGYTEKQLIGLMDLPNRNAVKNKKYNAKMKLRMLVKNDPSFKKLYE